MSSVKLSIVALALFAAVSCTQAAGGIKGAGRLQPNNDAPRAIKGPLLRPPVQQQQYLPPPPPPPPAAVVAAVPAANIQAIKAGPGQVAPVFTPARVQPIIVQQEQEPPIQQIQQVQLQQQQEPEPSQLQQQVQQQQQEEIDPNAAAQDNAPAIAAPAVAAPARASEEEANPRPEPYAFQYAFEAADSTSSGSSQREEQQDASGRVTGFYTLKGEDGRDRRVDYVADASGFRATISTNEMGTAPKDSADVDWNAQNPTDAQLRTAESATQAARQRALLNPPQQQPIIQQQIASGSQRSLSKQAPPRSKTSPVAQQQQLAQQTQQQQQQEIVQQLQEPFEQIRQTELNGRARKSRHAPFYLFTV